MVIALRLLAHLRYKNPRTLEDIGNGIDIEEQRAWEGFWNEDLVETAKQAIKDPETLAVLLTGRTEDLAPIILRMLKSKGLNFDMVICKPKSVALWTLEFKLSVMDDLLPPSTGIEEVVIYEDRPKHRDTFTEYLEKRIRRTTIDSVSEDSTDENLDAKLLSKAEVVFVELERYYLEPSVEDALVLDMMRRSPAKQNHVKPEGICAPMVVDETNETLYNAENVPPTVS